MSKITLRHELRQLVNSLDYFKADINLLELNYKDLSSITYDPQLIKYFRHYRFLHSLINNSDKIKIDYYISKFKAFDFDIVTQIIKKNNTEYKGIVVFTHGYLDHLGLYSDLIEELVSNNYVFVGLDLPGHGLSTGKIADIVDFGQYAHCIEELLTNLNINTSNNTKLPLSIMGFSAGAAISTEYLLRNSHSNLFSKAVWFAPLLRVPMWRYTELARYLVPFVQYVPRNTRCSSHSSKFVNFIRSNDPLQPRMLPLRWVKAMHEWHARLPKYKPLSTDLCMIQGTNDKTIDWKYNLPNFAKIFPHHRAHYIYGAYHNLCNETHEYRDLVFKYMLEFIN